MKERALHVKSKTVISMYMIYRYPVPLSRLLYYRMLVCQKSEMMATNGPNPVKRVNISDVQGDRGTMR
jgi:hypothetical protein